MPLKPLGQLSFGDISSYQRKNSRKFFSQINQLVHWPEVEEVLRQYYPKGFRISGKPAYPPLLLFKMMLLQTWYGLSDYQVEEEVNDRLSFNRFCGLSLDDNVPDHSVLSRFRTLLTKNQGLEVLFNLINQQLSIHGLTLSKGAVVDASLIPTPRKPKGKKGYDLHKDGSVTLSTSYQQGVDQEGSWGKKGTTLCYGYKRHIAVDSHQGLVLAVVTTKASTSDSTTLGAVLNKVHLKPRSRIYADKGYTGKPNEKLLNHKNLRNAIQQKQTKNRKLSTRQKQRNTIISKTRYKVERVFGSIKSWFKAYGARYLGIAKMHTQNLMEAIAYNLYRAPNCIVNMI